MYGIMQAIQNAFVTVDYNGDGYEERNARLDIQGHDVQVVHEQGSKMFTVFVDGDCAVLTKDRVEGWISARLR